MPAPALCHKDILQWLMLIFTSPVSRLPHLEFMQLVLLGFFCGPSSLPVFLPPSVQPVMFLLRQLLRDGRAPHACFVLYKVLSLYLLALASGKNFFSFSVCVGEEL